MNRQTANRILTLWKNGEAFFTRAVINKALAVTGDLQHEGN